MSGLLVGFQLAVVLLHPPWRTAVTDWLRTGLAWPEMLALGLVAAWCRRTHRSSALAWWIGCAALLAYAIGQSVWTVLDQFILPDRIPDPSWPDLFFLLQYPFFFLALARPSRLPTRGQPWLGQSKVIVDSLLLMGALAALSWYFLLAPIYLASTQPFGAKLTDLAYPLGDLAVLFGLILTLLPRPPRNLVERRSWWLLIAATTCLVIADSSFTLVELQGRYHPGGFSDILWMACYLLFPLAGLTYVRLIQREPGRPPAVHGAEGSEPSITREDLLESCRFLLPFLAAVLAGVAIEFRTVRAPLPAMNPLVSHLVGFGLLVLALLRQELVFLEQAQLRRQREAARTRELALREVNQRLEAFLGIASHELKTPLTTILLGLQGAIRRDQGGSCREPPASEAGRTPQLALLLSQAQRLDRLVTDLLDTAHIQAGKLQLNLKPANLSEIVRTSVEAQRVACPERTVALSLPEGLVPVLVDANRIGQVVLNYLTNALKYSRADRPVEVNVQVESQQGRVRVRDQGPGIPPGEQERLWERFHRVPGIEIQSGSGIGLGIGLYLSKTIIEQHGGQVGIQSAPGAGATFWLTLPLVAAGQEQEGSTREDLEFPRS